MNKTLIHTEERPLRLRLGPLLNMTDDQLYELCQLNPELRIERTAQGELLIMPPAGGETSKRNLDLIVTVCGDELSAPLGSRNTDGGAYACCAGKIADALRDAGLRGPHLPASTVAKKSLTARLKASGSSMLMV
jgi:hypothetical protein